jgi:hypothetical protein
VGGCRFTSKRNTGRLAHTYGFLSDLIDDAHVQAGLPVTRLVITEQDGSITPFRGSEVYFQGRLPCMVASESYRELWIEHRSGATAEFTTKQNKLTKSGVRQIKRRYGTSILESNKPLQSLADWAMHLWRIARHMFERDGAHVHIAFLLHEGKILEVRGIDADTWKPVPVVSRSCGSCGPNWGHRSHRHQ